MLGGCYRQTLRLLDGVGNFKSIPEVGPDPATAGRKYDTESKSETQRAEGYTRIHLCGSFDERFKRVAGQVPRQFNLRLHKW